MNKDININDIAFNLAQQICKPKTSHAKCACNVEVVTGLNRYLKNKDANTLGLPTISREDKIITRLGC